jgi:hypothetical protein
MYVILSIRLVGDNVLNVHAPCEENKWSRARRECRRHLGKKKSECLKENSRRSTQTGRIRTSETFIGG